MKLSAIKAQLQNISELKFQLPDGTLVPRHFHVTEVGMITKNFIDCGGSVRNEKVVNFQLWQSTDYDHRLHPEKLLHIIELSEKVLKIDDLEVEVEYQADTIGKFGLTFKDDAFLLTTKLTDCLAKDKCGVPEEATGLKFEKFSLAQNGCCSPGSGCC
ncbi:MAG: DUF6428 family protein [Prolixibacteraceae bacterium]